MDGKEAIIRGKAIWSESDETWLEGLPFVDSLEFGALSCRTHLSVCVFPRMKINIASIMHHYLDTSARSLYSCEILFCIIRSTFLCAVRM